MDIETYGEDDTPPIVTAEIKHPVKLVLIICLYHQLLYLILNLC